MIRNGSPVFRTTQEIERDREVLDLFKSTFIPLAMASSQLLLSDQYARRKVLSHGTEEIDYYMVWGRIYVSVNFLEQLKGATDG